MARKRKSIMFLPGNSLVTRNYLSTPFFEQLVKMKESYNLDVYFAGIESNPVSKEIITRMMISDNDLHYKLAKKNIVVENIDSSNSEENKDSTNKE